MSDHMTRATCHDKLAEARKCLAEAVDKINAAETIFLAVQRGVRDSLERGEQVALRRDLKSIEKARMYAATCNEFRRPAGDRRW